MDKILLTMDDSLEDEVSRDSLFNCTDEDAEFNEDGSFIGEYSDPNRCKKSESDES